MLFCSLAFGQNGALRITEPTPGKTGRSSPMSLQISLKGTLDWKGGDRRVIWESNRGFSDLATVTLAGCSKTILWSSSAPVPLRRGNQSCADQGAWPTRRRDVCKRLLHAEIARAAAGTKNDDLPWKTDHLRGERRIRDLSKRYDPGQGCRRGSGRICRPLRPPRTQRDCARRH